MMQWQTPVDVPSPSWRIQPTDRILCVGSCFAGHIGRRFQADHFRAVVNPFGVMYNPASILHTVERYLAAETAEVARTAVFTLGTNRVYILNETGEIVDNCQKRPQRLFTERSLSVDECAAYLREAIARLRNRRPDVRVILTVSPIRYAKYGFHGSAVSKATLLLAADEVARQTDACVYFPAYEIVCDELRDYRFYAPDMLHPSQQAVDYIWERFADTFFSSKTKAFMSEWLPIKAALNHRPFNPESAEHRAFIEKTQQRVATLKAHYPELEI